jgi:hypothetical protein
LYKFENADDEACNHKHEYKCLEYVGYVVDDGHVVGAWMVVLVQDQVGLLLGGLAG